MTAQSSSAGDFDALATRYDEVLNRGLRVTGETKDYFALARVRWLGRRLRRWGLQPRRILDFGCGTGTAIPLLREEFGPDLIVGADLSTASLHEAARRSGGPGVTFRSLDQLVDAGDFDLVFANGVFHHMPPAERDAALGVISRSLTPGGIFALWENNPVNPGTRWVMRRLPFDRGAVLLMPAESRRRVRDAGLDVVTTDYLFFFPRILKWLRPLEPWLRGLPLGGQYLVVSTKPPQRQR